MQNWEVKRCRIGRRIGRCNDAILSGDFRGAKVQNWEANREVQGCKLGGSTGQNWQMQRLRIGRRIGRCNSANWEGECGKIGK
jgi:hypothetical protein